METGKITTTKKAEILDKQKKYLFPNHLLYYTEPLPLERGEGLYVWDVEGRKYLDFFGGILTTSVGHNRPEVTQAVQEQAGKLIHSSTLYPNEAHVNLAEKMAHLAPGRIQLSYFTTSGTDADETAVMLARTHTGNQEIIALRHGYSGRSAMGMSLTGHSPWRIGGTHILGIKHAINPYCYRCPLKLQYPSCGMACAHDVEDVIRTTTSGRIAAFLAEPIQGVGGFITPPPEYFKIVAEIIRHFGGLFISDEVQTGFGRTGGKWFGIEHWEVEPDIMTMAKGIANGFPLGNTMTRPDIAASTTGAGLTISTFGGNPVACAASLATMEVLEKEAGPQHVARVGKVLRTGLERLMEKHAFIGDVRGMGLMQGLEFVRDRKSKEPAPKATSHFMELCRNEGLLIGKGGLYGNVIRIAPPMTASIEDVEEALELMGRALTQVGVD
ncbi:MAG: aspartate aminotransferase family protein [Phaeodactylibacter sp.]|nr:aspartate aminotransferase family protein [Phaeodactylibacter sp.]MCB9049018.1 aspartate aminotransferase family protein [Lewinellaceae bacterium]